ncbi:MAG TPA: zf-HC2 domain-containing protein [Pyrinomonadaceae bacterium]
MKCEVCLELLEEYFDGELVERESSEVASHLSTCVMCANESAALTAEQELFSRYDREFEVSTLIWEQVAQRTIAPVVTPASSGNKFGEWFVGLFKVPTLGFSVATAALILIAVLVGAGYLRNRPVSKVVETVADGHDPRQVEPPSEKIFPTPKPTVELPERSPVIAVNRSPKVRRSLPKQSPIDQSDVVSTDLGYQDPDDKDTANHLEQTQNLLRSFKNVRLNDGEQEIDVTYDKAVGRRLLNENIVLRREAEAKARFPTKALLSDLEPFLIDIANLPDQAKPEDVRAIKERVQKTEIVAALIGYE